METESQPDRWLRQILVLTIVAVAAGIVALGAVPTAAVADHANSTDDRIQVVDAYRSGGGNTTVAVQATTTESVSDLQFTYDNGTETGPLTLDNDGVVGAVYDDQQTPFTSVSSFNSSSYSDGIVFFELNQSWEAGRVTINASAEGVAYGSADRANRSVLTTNAYAITLQNATGSTVDTFTPVAVSNASTGTVRGFLFVQGGSAAFHCGGVLDGTSCEDPDTDGESHTYQAGGSKFEPQALPASLSVRAFNLPTANGSVQTTLTGSQTLTLNKSVAPVEYLIQESGATPQSLSLSNVTELRVENRTSGATVQRWDSNVSPVGILFLSPKTDYDLVIEHAGGTERRPMTIPTKGFRRQQLRIQDGSTPQSAVVGQVITDSGSPVSDVTVTAEPTGANNNPPVINSTTTNTNGLFRMLVPETAATGDRIQLQLASSQTDNGTLSYFPTRDDSDGDGYRVRDSRTIVGQLEIQRGGEVDITVTNGSGGPIASPQALTSLSQTTTTTGDRTRESLVETFSQFSFDPTNEVNETVVRVPSPTTSLQDDVSYNVWGLSPSLGVGDELCARQVDVSQGDRSDSSCELEAGGTLNISLSKYPSLIEQTGTPESVRLGDAGNVIIVRDADTGNVTTYLGPGSIQRAFIETDSEGVLSLPVPEGNYTVEVRPRDQFVNRTSVRNTTAVEVATGSTGRSTLVSGQDFPMEIDFDRTDRVLRRAADNTVAITVDDPATGERLNGTQVDTSVRLFYRNGTVASESVSLSYNGTDQTFDNTSYTPAVAAGEYIVEATTTYEDGTSSYNTTVRDRLRVSDFSAEIRTEQQTVAPGETILAGLRAYDTTSEPPEALDATSNNITLVLYDRDGNAIGQETAQSGITGGSGTIQLPAISETGLYRIGVIVESNDGRQGVDDTWIRVSGYDVDVEVDRSVYTPDETVVSNVTVTNSTTGEPVSGARLETRVFSGDSRDSQASLTNTTNANGHATIVLDPATLFAGSGGQWDGSSFVGVEATIDTGSELSTVRGGTGISVRAFQTDVSAAQEQFEATENPVLDVVVPPRTNVDASNITTTLNGEDVSSTVIDSGRGYYRLELAQQSDGDYRAQVELTTDNGQTASDRARFVVSSLNVRAEPSARSYALEENITVRAEARYQNGSTAANQPVTMELFRRGSEPIFVTDNTTQTNSNGVATAQLSPAAEGIHAVVVSAGGSETVVPVVVNDLTTNFTDGSNTPVDSYEFTPGETGTINVSVENATDDGIDGQMVVRALIAGERTELGSSEITGGTGGISFSIPESANTGSYPVEVFVRSESGVFDSTTASIELTGGVALETDVQETVYEPDDDARIQATVTRGDSPAANEQVRFTLLSESAERSLGNATTGPDGTATLDATVPANLTEGEYGVRATVVDEGVDAYDGIFVSTMDLSIETNQSAYAAGETVLVNLSATADDDPVTSAQGGVRIRLADGSTVTESFNSSAQTVGEHYEVEIDLPEDDAAIGSRTVGSYVRNGSSVATESTTVSVFNASEDASLSVPERIIANGSSLTVTANATVETTGTLTVFSPGTASVTHEEDLNLNETTTLSIADPGTYVFSLSVPGVGTETVVRNVDAGPDDPELQIGPDLSTNATAFTESDDIHIRTESNDMTATVFNESGSFTVPLNRQSGTTNYGVIESSDAGPGPYLIRLDGPNSTDVDSVLIEVSSS